MSNIICEIDHIYIPQHLLLIISMSYTVYITPYAQYHLPIILLALSVRLANREVEGLNSGRIPVLHDLFYTHLPTYLNNALPGSMHLCDKNLFFIVN